jgi:cytochrome P450
MNPLYYLGIWKNNQAIERILAPLIRPRAYGKSNMGTGIENNHIGRTILDIVAKTWQSQKQDLMAEDKDAFFDSMLQNVKIFMLAGHDTTTATICYALEMLARHPREVAKLRDEHDSAFGKDLGSVTDIIQSSPETLNKLPFTLAVIKECLRLFPLAVTVRQGSSSFNLNKGGTSWPTEGFHVQTAGWNIHSDPKYWQRVNEFVPDRWLSGKEDSLHPIRNAWRPFEHGPMNCIGQDFALLVIKIAAIMASREFDVECAWEEWDEVR